jgi:hypothetical protein
VRASHLRSAVGAFSIILLLSSLAKEVLTATIPPVTYDKEAQDLLLEKTKNRKQLSPSDERAKTKILGLLPPGKTSGTLYTSPNVIIGYVSSANDLNVEIQTTDIDTAKKEAVDWFINQGFSQEAICNYPVSFQLDGDVAESLRGKNILFNPLADGCKPSSKKNKAGK